MKYRLTCTVDTSLVRCSARTQYSTQKVIAIAAITPKFCATCMYVYASWIGDVSTYVCTSSDTNAWTHSQSRVVAKTYLVVTRDAVVVHAKRIKSLPTFVAKALQ